MQAVPESLLMLHGTAAYEQGSGDAGLFLHVGLANGVLQRTEVDRITGARARQWPALRLQYDCCHCCWGAVHADASSLPTGCALSLASLTAALTHAASFAPRHALLPLQAS